jgi:glycosyltransferase involved in cell wall biosynthesis
MRRAKLLVLPSLEEGLGAVLLEAMSCGTPCIATAIGGITDVLTPETGILVQPRNPEAISKAILEILSATDLWQKLSENGRIRVVENFSWEKIAGHLLKRFQQVAGSNL